MTVRLSPGDIFAGKLRLEHRFASGGMGTVWRARNLQLDIPVAVKVMSPAAVETAGFAARFEREARAAAQIRSPHVVSIYEHGVHGTLPYIVMELLEGEDLQQRLKRDKRLPLYTTVKIIRDICKALHRAHELGIIHRDLKPANIFLARDMDEELVKILDFGIAKLMQDGGGGSITATGEMMGTPHYMSPEQVKAAKHVDHRADLWAVSAIAFRALTGQVPFGGHAIDAIQQILTDTAPPPSSVAPDLPPALDAFFARALARDIDARFQSARDLSDALVRLTGRESLVELPAPNEADPADELPTIALLRPLAMPPRAAPPRAAPPVSAPPVSAPPVSAPPVAQPPAAASTVPVVVAAPAPAAPNPAPGTQPVHRGGGTMLMVDRSSARPFNPPVRSAAAEAARQFHRTVPLEPRPPRGSATGPAPAEAIIPPPAPRRPWIVWAAIAAALIVIAVVLSAVLSASSGSP
jgi:eukaryotic-like serine/threonine-protein kinase